MTVGRIVGNGFIAASNLVRSARSRAPACVCLRLEGTLPEMSPPRPRLPFPLGFFVRRTSQPSLNDVREAFDVLGSDDRVRCVVLLLDSIRAGMSALYSLRRLVAELRTKGKVVVAWLPSAGLHEYYLAAACDIVLMPESGRLEATGLRAEARFLRDTLRMVGVEADLEAIAEYKTPPDMFRRDRMSEPHRHMLDALLGSVFSHFVEAVAEGRGLDAVRVVQLIDSMPMGPAAASEAGLIDGLAYEDEILACLQELDAEAEAGQRMDAGSLQTWQQALGWLRRPLQPISRKAIGVVSLDGMIVMGRSHRSPIPLPLPLVQSQAGSTSVISALRRAEADRSVAAVILTIESPGGSALASDLIWREVARLRRRKPVVALLGEQATSGGYYVAAGANRIVARPTTMTGSIGVWGGKFVLKDLFAKLGVGSDAVQRGAMAGLQSELTPYTDLQRKKVMEDLGSTYTRFLRIVSEGRGIDRSRMDEVARGRLWSGAQAVEVGLVDKLGDFRTARELAMELAALEPGAAIRTVVVPPGRSQAAPQPFPDNQASWSEALFVIRDLAREGVWALSPWDVRIEG